MNCPQKITLSLHTNYETALQVFFSFVTVTLDDFCPSLVIQVMPNSTPAEILIVTVGKRNGIFQVSLGNGEGESNVWCKTSEPFQIRHLSRQENERKKYQKENNNNNNKNKRKKREKGRSFPISLIVRVYPAETFKMSDHTTAPSLTIS